MKAAYINTTGNPSVIQVGERPDPVLITGEVMIEVRAVGVNPIDTYVRSGLVGTSAQFPHILGCDAAGVVIAAPKHSDLVTGDRVWTTLQGGASGRQGVTAEKIAVPVGMVGRMPGTMTFEEIAAMGLPCMTAFYALHCRCGLNGGQRVLIDGASGAVGSMAVQWAKYAGAEVIAVTGSAKGAAHCNYIGADHVLLRAEGCFEDELASTAADGIDLWWDLSRNPMIERAVRLLRLGGKIIVASGRNAQATLPVGPFYAKGLTMHGIVVYDMSTAHFAGCVDSVHAASAAGKLCSPKYKVLPWWRIAEAHAKTEHGEGKYVLNGFGD